MFPQPKKIVKGRRVAGGARGYETTQVQRNAPAVRRLQGEEESETPLSPANKEGKWPTAQSEKSKLHCRYWY